MSATTSTPPWDDWFEKFERESLVFVYQHEKASGEPSTFFRLVDRDEDRDEE